MSGLHALTHNKLSCASWKSERLKVYVDMPLQNVYPEQ